MATEQVGLSKRGIITFILGSLFGIGMFLWPLDSEGAEFSTGLSLVNDWFTELFSPAIDSILLGVTIIAVLGMLLGVVAKGWVHKNLYPFRGLFILPWPYALTRVIAMLVTICVYFEVGPESIRSADVGAGMIDLSKTLVSIAFSLSFILPFLTDCGLMEFCGVMLRPLTRPLFGVPGRASVDLIASWLASSNTAVLITGEQYKKGFYTRREAGIIMTNFSLVSIPFCMVVAEAMHLSHIFLPFYAAVTAIGLFLAVICCRLWPLSNLDDEYNGEKRINEHLPEDARLLHWAFSAGVNRASTFDIVEAFRQSFLMALSIIFDLIPIVIAWGTIGSFIVNYTPIFHYLSYPMGWYMSLFGVPEAYQVAPATLVGFIDMFIPVLITSPDVSEHTRFLIAGLSLVQIVYMTEVGSIIVKSGVGIDIKKLFVIFMQRTIISIPLLILAAKLIL